MHYEAIAAQRGVFDGCNALKLADTKQPITGSSQFVAGESYIFVFEDDDTVEIEEPSAAQPAPEIA